MDWIDLLLMLLTAGATAWELLRQHRAMKPGEKKPWKRYAPFLYHVHQLPLLFVLMLPLLLLRNSDGLVTYVFFDYLVSICFYAAVLLLSFPLLRRYFSARFCAVAWLLPGMLYYLGAANRTFRRPLLVIPVEEGWIRWGEWIWMAGCLAVVIWKITEHLLFRKRLLQQTYQVEDPLVLTVWREELHRIFPKNPDLELGISPLVSTPLSIGVFQGTTVVVLPERQYEESQLRLILRHELIHISRNDGMNKLFLNFCCAVCWFNPLVWLLMKKSAQDLERSCDETVLLTESEPVRREYARLLLSEAGEGRGFTTCLAANASDMRYRLKSAMNSRTLRSGALMAVALCVLLGLSYGRVMLTSGYTTAAQAVESYAGEVTPTQAVLEKDQAVCEDREALLALLEHMRLCGQVIYRRDYSPVIAKVELTGGFSAELRECTLTLRGDGHVTYYIPEGLPMAELEALFS